MPQTVQSTRIKPIFDVLIKTEQEEPLLLLADHVAGYFYSDRMYGQREENSRASMLYAAKESVLKIPEYCLMVQEGPFNEDYLLSKEIFEHVIPRKQREKLRAKLIEHAFAKSDDDFFTEPSKTLLPESS